MPAAPGKGPQPGAFRLDPDSAAADAGGDLASAELQLCPLWGQRTREGILRGPNGHTPTFCPPPTLSFLPPDRSAALS